MPSARASRARTRSGIRTGAERRRSRDPEPGSEPGSEPELTAGAYAAAGRHSRPRQSAAAGRNSSLAVNTEALIRGPAAHRSSWRRSGRARTPSSPRSSSVIPFLPGIHRADSRLQNARTDHGEPETERRCSLTVKSCGASARQGATARGEARRRGGAGRWTAGDDHSCASDAPDGRWGHGRKPG